ncbi:MAG: hydrogenase [Candidatus Bipolaricaulota bacterium]
MSGIDSGFGSWNPLAWALLFLGAGLVALGFRALGRSDRKRASEQGRAFLSGNEEPQESAALHVRGRHLYWGIVDGLAGYYRRAASLHTGIVNDYVAWFVVGLAAVCVILLGVG